jgi:cysteinyl-tRNA synthetase
VVIQVYDTMSRSLTPLVTRDEGQVGMYVCGPTVQAAPHVGHGRSAVNFDVMRRYLEWRGYTVTLVRNVTDIEDKIIAAAEAAGEPVEVLAARMTDEFTAAYAALGCGDPDVEPKASEHIPEMIELIERLIDRGLAYVRGADVWFSVRSLEGYGRLSGTRPEELRSGYRIEVDESKEDPLDFALWKSAKPGEPFWSSPWGEGRPGWHIECAAMAVRYLGMGFDIHGGGTDLVFPHHENEIAQSEGASGVTFARYWLHNGMVNLGAAKMAKSTGNVVDLAEVLRSHGGRALRVLFLRAHYRSPIDYSPELLGEAVEAMSRLDRFRGRATPGEPDPDAMSSFRRVMDDDFSTPEAISLLFDLVREGNRRLDEGADASGISGAVEEIVDVLGLDRASLPAAVALDLRGVADRFGVTGSVDEVVSQLVVMRDLARSEGRFDDADTIRASLEEAGITLEDGPDGTRWIRG